MSGYPPSNQPGRQRQQQQQQPYADPFTDRHSPLSYGPGQAASPAGSHSLAQQQQQQSPYMQSYGAQPSPRPSGYTLHDNPSYANSMQTLPMDSSYSLHNDKHDFDGGAYPDEEVESKTPLRSEFGHPPGQYDPDQPL